MLGPSWVAGSSNNNSRRIRQLGVESFEAVTQVVVLLLLQP
jgi:hypothetical protein